MPANRRLSVALLAAALLATSSACGAADERYALERRGDHIVRLDRETGAVSHCVERGQSLVCEAAADDLAALQEEIARLDGALGEAERRIASLEESNAAERERAAALEAENRTLRRALKEAGIAPPERSGKLSEGLPSEEDVQDLADWFGMVSRVFRDLLGDLAEERPGEQQL